MRNLLLFILIILVHYLPAQTYSELITDNQIVEFINWHINKDESAEEKIINKHILQWDTTHITEKTYSPIFTIGSIFGNGISTFEGHKIDSLFSREDKEYILEQAKTIKKSLWSQPFENSIFQNEANNNPQKRIYSYSIPLFSKNNKYVILYDSYYCGFLCGKGGYSIFEYIGNKKWKYFGIIYMYVS